MSGFSKRDLPYRKTGQDAKPPEMLPWIALTDTTLGPVHGAALMARLATQRPCR
jgi:hypothetical protein